MSQTSLWHSQAHFTLNLAHIRAATFQVLVATRGWWWPSWTACPGEERLRSAVRQSPGPTAVRKQKRKKRKAVSVLGGQEESLQTWTWRRQRSMKWTGQKSNDCTRLPHFYHACTLSHFNRARLFETPWTVAHQASLSVGFPRQEHCSGLPGLPPRDLPDPGTEPLSPLYPALETDPLPLASLGKPLYTVSRALF